MTKTERDGKFAFIESAHEMSHYVNKERALKLLGLSGDPAYPGPDHEWSYYQGKLIKLAMDELREALAEADAEKESGHE